MLISANGYRGVNVFAANCKQRPCLRPGTFETRGATGSGSRSTGNRITCCLTRAYHGCPKDADLPLLDHLQKAVGLRIGDAVTWGALGKQGILKKIKWVNGPKLTVRYRPPGAGMTNVHLTKDDDVRLIVSNEVNPKNV